MALDDQRRHVVVKVFPSDRRKIQQLSYINGKETRHEALLELEPIVQDLKLETERKPIRVAIPNGLDAAIKTKMEQTKRTYVDILLAAIEEYATKHGYEWEDSTDE